MQSRAEFMASSLGLWYDSVPGVALHDARAHRTMAADACCWQVIRTWKSNTAMDQSHELIISIDQNSTVRHNVDLFDCQDGKSSFPSLVVTSHNTGTAKTVTLGIQDQSPKADICGLSSHMIQKSSPLQLQLQGCEEGEVPPRNDYGACSKCLSGVCITLSRAVQP